MLVNKIVDAIISDFTDRRGLRQEWENIDSDTQTEIVSTWCESVAHILKAHDEAMVAVGAKMMLEEVRQGLAESDASCENQYGMLHAREAINDQYYDDLSKPSALEDFKAGIEKDAMEKVISMVKATPGLQKHQKTNLSIAIRALITEE